MVAIPKKDGRIRTTVNYKKLNAISSLGRLPTPRVDEVLDSLGKGRIFSLFDLVSSFHHITIDKDTIPLTAFCTATRLFEWFVMPQGSSAAPGWFVKVQRGHQGPRPRSSLPRRRHSLRNRPRGPRRQHRLPLQTPSKAQPKFSPSKAKLGTTDADFQGHTISPSGVSPNTDKVGALTKIPMSKPKNTKQTRPLLGGIGYYSKFLKNLSTRLRSMNALLKQGVKFAFTP